MSPKLVIMSKELHRFGTTTVSRAYISTQFMLILDADISIDGDTAVAFTENVEQRFLSYGWEVLHVDDGDRFVLLFGSSACCN